MELEALEKVCVKTIVPTAISDSHMISWALLNILLFFGHQVDARAESVLSYQHTKEP